MQLGERAEVLAEQDGQPVVVGTAQLITPDIAQAVPPLDEWLLTNGPGADLTVVADGERPDPVRGVYPAFADGDTTRELAAELGYTGDTNDSAKMNMWLHKALMKKLSENGGKVPADLLD